MSAARSQSSPYLRLGLFNPSLEASDESPLPVASIEPPAALDSVRSPPLPLDPSQIQALIGQLQQLLPTSPTVVAAPIQHRPHQPVLKFSDLLDEADGELVGSTPLVDWCDPAALADKYRPRIVPESQRVAYARQTTLPQFYRDCGTRWDVLRLDAKAKTHTKDRQILNRWIWGTRPENWPATMPWEGPTLAVIEAANHVLMDEFVRRMQVSSPRDPNQGLSHSTIASTWSPLSTMLRHAVAMNAIRRFPSPSKMPDLDVEARPYTDEEIERLWLYLGGHPLLRVALVVSVNCGLRTVDLFTLRRDALVLDKKQRWTLKFISTKTGKKHWLPLAAVTLNALRVAIGLGDKARLPAMTPEYFFPGLSEPNPPANHQADKEWDPEDSYLARKRARLCRQVWDAAGLQDVDKPWQSGRSTCASRLSEMTRLSHGSQQGREAGKFLLGTDSKETFTTHYAPARDDHWEAVLNVPQPTCFLREFGS